MRVLLEYFIKRSARLDHRKHRPAAMPLSLLKTAKTWRRFEMLTQKFLKSIFDYDPETGIFTRKSGAKCGYLRHDGYSQIQIKRKKYMAHRLAWIYIYGSAPARIDHINGDQADNRIINLRSCSHSQNMANSSISKNNTSGFKGVVCAGERWVAKISNQYLGTHATPEQAAKAYDKKALELFGEFAVTNQSMGLLP